MRFEWDERKSRTNLAKHKVSFGLARLVFDDPQRLSLRDERENEERWLTLGLVKGTVVLVVAHTVREENDEEVIRIISARKASRRERERYEHPHGEI